MPLFGPPSIQKLQAKNDVKGLVKALTYQKDWSVRKDAAIALGDMGDERALEPLIAALQEGHEDVRREAARALGRIPTKERAIEPLIAALKDSSAYVRCAAVGTLGQIGDGRAVEPLISALQDGEGQVRSAAAGALGQIGDGRAVEPLISALQDRESKVRGEAARVLGRLGDTRAVEPLLASLKDDQPDAPSEPRFFAAEALVRMGDVRGVADIIVAANTQTEWVSRRASQILATIIGDMRVVEPLIAALGSPGYHVRGYAVETLGKIGRSAIEPLIAALTAPCDALREGAAKALGEIGDERAIEPLVAALRDRGTMVRINATSALARHGRSAVEPLISALQDRDPNVRSSAAEVLGRIGDARSVEPLGIVLGDNTGFVRSRAAEALMRIGSPRAKELLELSKQRTAELSIESLKDGVFYLSEVGFVGPNEAWVDRVRQENHTAHSWFRAQGFAPIPTSDGEEGAAEYCFDMASQAQSNGNTQEAWAGFHEALYRFGRLPNAEMLGLTCHHLGQVYGARGNWEMARLLFLESAYLAHAMGKEEGYAWALFYLGDTSDKLGEKDLAIQFLSEALPVFQRASPKDAPGVQAALLRLLGGRQGNKQPGVVTSCPECGSPVFDGAIRCHKCGHRFV